MYSRSEKNKPLYKFHKLSALKKKRILDYEMSSCKIVETINKYDEKKRKDE
jgi:hypothetical protein